MPHSGRLNRDRGRGGLDTSIELRQRRTTAGADGAQRLEVLEVGLGPPAPVAAWDSRALAAADGDKGKRGCTSLMGDSVSSHVPWRRSERRRHSVERNDALAGGGTEGKSDFLRFPCCCVVGVAT
uniref:Uncharacterized protein n=1 Tax=Cynoglossus semilaevis TaxID=244447 RepID=A0A3P8UL92_CYNSE